MRAILFLLILVVVAAILALASGFVDVRMLRGARAPEVQTTANGVSAQGGEAPAFDVETGSVSVGARQANVVVPVPEVRVNPPGEQANTQRPQQTPPQQPAQGTPPQPPAQGAPQRQP